MSQQKRAWSGGSFSIKRSKGLSAVKKPSVFEQNDSDEEKQVLKPLLEDNDDSDGEKPGEVVQQDEDDPLDAFMADLKPTESTEKKDHGLLDSIALDEEQDYVASFLESRKKSNLHSSVSLPTRASGYNSDDDVYATAAAVDRAQGKGQIDFRDRKNHIDPLKPIDHSNVQYLDFNKNFYNAVDSIAGMSPADIRQERRLLNVKVGGYDVPCPIRDFGQLPFEQSLQALLHKRGYTKPTPIQSQAIPTILSGRDILGIAKTGSGKTAAFVLPLITHILDQKELERGEGPIAVLVAPTRELAAQILVEVRKFTKAYGIASSGIFGGMSKQDQFKDLRGVCDIVVCTPGRMIDLIRMKACNFRRVTYLVLDEADRMFDMGFEPQVWSIVGQVRPDRQTLLFSATMPRKVEHLAQSILTDPVRVTIGREGEANEDIEQIVHVLHDDSNKVPWLLQNIESFCDNGNVLVFTNHKSNVEFFVGVLLQKGYKVSGLHGDMIQGERMGVIKALKESKIHILVATDVASRGLDIPSIKTVLNIDAAKDIETHVHRIGRTGRAGDREGRAFTLVTRKQSRFAGILVNSLARAHQQIPKELYELAVQDKRFAYGRQRRAQKGNKGQRRRVNPNIEFDNSFVSASTNVSERPKNEGVRVIPALQKTSMVAGASKTAQSAQAAAAAAAAAIGRRLSQSNQVNPSKSAAHAALAISARINKGSTGDTAK